MPIEPFMLTTIGFGLLAILLWIKARNNHEDARLWRGMYDAVSKAHRRDRGDLMDHRAREIIEKHKRSQIARLGGKAKAAKIKAEAPARRARTIDAIAHTAFRPREEVVADVLTNRRARNHLSAGVAAQRP